MTMTTNELLTDAKKRLVESKMITIEELDEAKQKGDEAFNKYDQNGGKTAAKDLCLRQKQYYSMFDEY